MDGEAGRFSAKLEKLLSFAAECQLISGLATDRKKRDLFQKLATDIRSMVTDIQAVIAARTEGGE
jgi:hypothetical protein